MTPRASKPGTHKLVTLADKWPSVLRHSSLSINQERPWTVKARDINGYLWGEVSRGRHIVAVGTRLRSDDPCNAQHDELGLRLEPGLYIEVAYKHKNEALAHDIHTVLIQSGATFVAKGSF